MAPTRWARTNNILHSVIITILEQNHVGLAARLAHRRDVHGRAILHGAHFFARTAADAKLGINVWPLDVHHLSVAVGNVDFLDPNALWCRRAKFFANDAWSGH